MSQPESTAGTATSTEGAGASMHDALVPRLARGFRLQWEPAQESHVLLYPEGMVKLNRSAGEILARCNGESQLVDIVDDLQQAFNAQGLRPEIEKFLEIAVTNRWIELRANA